MQEEAFLRVQLTALRGRLTSTRAFGTSTLVTLASNHEPSYPSASCDTSTSAPTCNPSGARGELSAACDARKEEDGLEVIGGLLQAPELRPSGPQL